MICFYNGQGIITHQLFVVTVHISNARINRYVLCCIYLVQSNLTDGGSLGGPMDVLISGGPSPLGVHLADCLLSNGHRVSITQHKELDSYQLRLCPTTGTDSPTSTRQPEDNVNAINQCYYRQMCRRIATSDH